MILRVIAVVIVLQALACATDISVKVFDSKSGSGIPNKEVQLQLWEHRSGKYEMRDMLRANTNSDGLATFHVPGPLPHDVIAMLNFGGWVRCVFAERHNTEDVIQRGAVEGASCGKQPISIQPEPGTIYIFARRKGFWESMRQIP